jgi:hypothetical protein
VNFYSATQQVRVWFNYPGKLLTQTSAAQVHSKITPVNFSSSARRMVKKYFAKLL